MRLNSVMILKALLYFIFHHSHPQKADVRPAEGIDLNRYLGRWYEQARFDTPFEHDLEEVFAEYKIRPDGNINITNSGVNGKHRRIEAHALGYPDGNGRLKVSFIPFLRCLTLPYNILFVDELYEHAIVSNDDASCLWFMSRHPVCNPDDFEIMRQEAIRRGFNLHNLHYTHHRYSHNQE